MSEVLSVPDVARDLGVSERRVRALIDAGRLPAGRIGRNWVVDGRAVNRFLQGDRRDGRPLSHSNAWALLALLAGERPSSLPSDAVSRLRRFARDPDWLIPVLRHSEPRSHELLLWVPQEDLRSLAGYPLVHAGLLAQSAVRQLDLLPRLDEPLDVYASEEVAEEIERRLLPEQSSDSPNLIVRIPSRSWVLHQSPEAPFPVVAADLLNHRDPRVRRAGEDALRRIVLGR